MTDTKEESPSKDVKPTSQPSTRKATIGAWWKSTTTLEKKEKPEKNQQARKPTGRRGRPKKSMAQAPLEKEQLTNRETGKSRASEETVLDAVAPVAAEETSPALSQQKKRVSRARKQTAPRKAKSNTSSQTQLEDLPVDTESNMPSVAKEEEQQPKKARPRRGRRKKTEVENNVSPAVEDIEIADQTDRSTDPEKSEQQEERPEAKKSPRKRGGRRKKSTPSKTDEKVGERSLSSEQQGEETQAEKVEAPEIAQLLESEQPVATAEKDPNDSKVSGKKEEKSQPVVPEHKPVIKLLINAEEPEECRLALLEDGRLESIHVATSTRTQTKNNIYKARIVAIEPNLQAAFVDYGTDKNGFLPFSEIHPEYYREDVSERAQKCIDQHQWKKLSITDVIEKGREVLVQVVKEEVGKKGANMTTYLSLPGRCVVLMPGSDSTGISRKISGEEKRSQLRDIMLSMQIPEGIGWIVRTASIDITKTALARDVGYLLKLWRDVKKKGQELDGVGMVYQDHDHVLRFLREHFDPDIQEILVDSKDALEQVQSFIDLLPSKQRKVRCKLHRGARPIFNQYSIEDQIESIYQPRVNLPSGGSIVIDPTEALVAIDVNSGSTQKSQNFEDTIFLANMEAAKELARQLRLRDLGGLIVVDFIDMRSKKNIREVERQVKAAMKRDKAKVDISRISKFGLMQISRQKLGAPIEAGNYRVCEHCKGRGIVRSVETLALYYLRRIHTGASRKLVHQIECRFPLDVAQYLLNNKRQELRDLEGKYTAEVVIIADPSFKPADNEILFHKGEKDDPSKKRT